MANLAFARGWNVRHVGEPVGELLLRFLAPLQVVLAAHEVADLCLEQTAILHFAVMRGDLGREVQQVVHRAVSRELLHLLAAERVQMRQAVDRAEVASHASISPHDANRLCRRLGTLRGSGVADHSLTTSGEAIDELRTLGRLLQEHSLLGHLGENFVDAVALGNRRPRLGGLLESLPQIRVALFVAERVECTFEREDDVGVLIVAATHRDFASEATAVADHSVAADLPQERQVNQWRAETVDGSLQDVLVSETVTSNLEIRHVVRRVRRTHDTTAVIDGESIEAAQRLVDSLVGNHRFRGERDCQDVAGSRALVLEGETDTSLVVAAQDVRQALQHFLVAEQFEDLRGESMGAVGGAERRPESTGRIELPIFDAKALDDTLLADLLDLDGSERSRGVLDLRGRFRNRSRSHVCSS